MNMTVSGCFRLSASAVELPNDKPPARSLLPRCQHIDAFALASRLNRLEYFHIPAHRLGPLVLIEPWPLKQLVNLLEVHARSLRHGEEHVEERQETPAGEEEERAPLVGALEQRRNPLINSEEEEPMEALREGCAEGPELVRPQLADENVRQNEETWW